MDNDHSPNALAVAAGSAIFAGEAWKWEVGGLLTAIHKGLDCDAYQSECRRSIRAYDGLAFRYQSLHEVNREDWQSELLALEEQLANLKENTNLSGPRQEHGFKLTLLFSSSIRLGFCMQKILYFSVFEALFS